MGCVSEHAAKEAYHLTCRSSWKFMLVGLHMHAGLSMANKSQASPQLHRFGQVGSVLLLVFSVYQGKVFFEHWDCQSPEFRR